MANCATCKSFILFGGEKVEGFRFCNKKCLAAGVVHVEAAKVTDAEIDAVAGEIHAGVCPLCEERTGVEVRKSYDIASFVLYTRYETHTHICCRVCALKKQSIDFIGSLFLGWWGFPWGLIMTPVQLLKNVAAMLTPGNTDAPSRELRAAARMLIAQQRLDEGVVAEERPIAHNPITEM